ncbi:uncharacterized protein LOC142574122 [Dermacentor variabilis]|uniref:uncharacterized protein LOC142574122 n=1 Tax=Dermacentor variabilis TaxID=34621 RepID=UPI003F5B0ABF
MPAAMLVVPTAFCIFFAAAFAEECSKIEVDDATMKEAGEVATNLMKECVHLLDKYPAPLSTIADGMKMLCNDYADCHDKHESLTSKPDEYRKELIKCVQPHFLKFYKSRPELKHDPEKVGKEVSECVMDHIPLSKNMGMAVGKWILKILGHQE